MPLWQPMQLLRNTRLSPPGLRLTSWRMRSGGRVVSCTCSMSRHRWFISVKRNIARLVPAMKNAFAAARVVMTPAVASAGRPLIADCVVRVRAVLQVDAALERGIVIVVRGRVRGHAGTAADVEDVRRQHLLNGTSSRTMPMTVAT